MKLQKTSTFNKLINTYQQRKANNSNGRKSKQAKEEIQGAEKSI